MSVTECRQAFCLALALTLVFGASARAASGDFDTRIMGARRMAAVDPQRGLVQLHALRIESTARLQLEARLAVDEAECRVLSDFDGARARAVADAGLLAAGAKPDGPARSPWLRLRACRAGLLVDMNDVAAGRAELEALMALTTSEADAPVHALAKLERGVHRSRTGDLLAAQQDLLEACATLQRRGPQRDRELCLGHLANHYRRVGDAEEALRLLVSLRDSARGDGATYDVGIFTFAIAQVQQSQRQWAESIESLREAAAANAGLGDATGVAYAENGIAVSLLRQGRAQEALPYSERSVERLDRGADPRQFENSAITRAEVLATLGRATDAIKVLDEIEAAVRKRAELPMLASWHLTRSRAMRTLGRWPQAYQALADARTIEANLQQQSLSEHSARLRMQFNRERDAEELAALRQLNEQGHRLRQTQAVALTLFVVLLSALMFFAIRKYLQTRHLHALASTDELTGLVNRRALFAYADDALARMRRDAKQLTVLMIDVDRFKQINDSHGHAVGDEVLRHLARVLAAGLRDRDRLGRYGGEEFLAILPEATLADARIVAERMRSAVASAPWAGPSGPMCLTVSIGVAAGHGAEPAAALIARADAAMYRAKNSGRDAVAVAVDESSAPPQSVASSS